MPNKPMVKHREHKAFYNPLLDFVNMPRMNAFDSSEGYYNTFFHELVHSTGHPSRLNRRELVQMAEFGSEAYSVEELTAEMGTCFLMSYCGFNGKNVENSASYIQGWLDKLKNDRRFVIYAAAKAQQAVDFILNVKTNEPEHVTENQVTDEQVADLPF
jgi:antirestriction protein ArdC